MIYNIFIEELKMYIESKTHDYNKTLSEIVVPSGMRLLNPYELIYLFKHDKYNVALHLFNTSEFCSDEENQNKICTFYSNNNTANWDFRVRNYKSKTTGVRFVTNDCLNLNFR